MKTTTLSVLAALLAAPAAARGEAVPPPAASQAPPAAHAPAPDASAAAAAVEFDEAVRLAAAHATVATLASEEVRRAEALLVQARSGSLPALSATGVYTHLSSNREQAGRTIAAEDQWSGSVSASVPLVVPSRWVQWSHASDAVAVARASLQDAQRGVTLLAARAYLAILAQKRAVDVSRRAVATAAAHFEFARARRAGGVGNALDEARSDQQLASAQVQLENALIGLARAQEALGIATGADRPLDAGGEPDLRLAVASQDALLREAEASRADVRAARERADAARRVARDSWADWLPSLSAVGQSFVQDPPTLTMPANGWQAQVVLSVPIFEGGLRVGQRRERLALVSEAYRAGATTSLDVVDAEQRARDADTAAVVAEDAVRQGRLDLLSAAGR